MFFFNSSVIAAFGRLICIALLKQTIPRPLRCRSPQKLWIQNERAQERLPFFPNFHHSHPAFRTLSCCSPSLASLLALWASLMKRHQQSLVLSVEGQRTKISVESQARATSLDRGSIVDVDCSPSNLMCALAPLEVHHRPSSGCIDPDLLELLNKIPRTLMPREYHIYTRLHMSY